MRWASRLALAATLAASVAGSMGCGGSTRVDPGSSGESRPDEEVGEGAVAPPAPLSGPYGVPLAVKAFPAKVADDAADGHPRLWVREGDLARLRAWARPSNPAWAVGVAPRLQQARALAARGPIDRQSECAVSAPYCESIAMIFALGSLVDPDPAERARDAARGRALLVAILERIDRKAAGDPFSDPRLAVYNRSRWSGEAFALAVDWLYPHLTKPERALARRVFLRWSEELLRATTTGEDHPKPVGVLAEARLVDTPKKRRHALNNYFASHARNLTLMSLALDPADDPDELGEPGRRRQYPQLRGYLINAVGAWWYVADRALREDARGGIAPEGAQYGSQTLAYYAQMALALRTSGAIEKEHFIEGSVPPHLGENPFWADLLPASLHLVTPSRARHEDWMGEVHEAATWGDAQRFDMGGGVDLWAPWGLEASLRGDGTRLEAARWVLRNLPSPDEKDWLRRVRGDEEPRTPLLHFLLFDPDAPPARDPRGAMPLSHRAEGLGWLLARTGWDAKATFFGAHAGWSHTDHQHGDGGDFFLYRRGEWLTKERSGYGPYFESTDSHNAVAIENAKPSRGGPRRTLHHERGSQWILSHDADAKLLGARADRELAHVAWDTTGLYQNSYDESAEVEHASRSVTWVVPDAIVVVDRVRTKVEGRFRRVFFQLPTTPVVSGTSATARTAGGQSLRIEALLPERATLSAARPFEDGSSETKPPAFEPMKIALRTDPPAPVGAATTFLHVLTASDPGVAPMTARRVVASTGWIGAEVGDVVVLAPSDVPIAAASVSLEWTSKARRAVVTGLPVGARFEVACSGDGPARRCTAKASAAGASAVDAAGLLVWKGG